MKKHVLFLQVPQDLIDKFMPRGLSRGALIKAHERHYTPFMESCQEDLKKRGIHDSKPLINVMALEAIINEQQVEELNDADYVAEVVPGDIETVISLMQEQLCE